MQVLLKVQSADPRVSVRPRAPALCQILAEARSVEIRCEK